MPYHAAGAAKRLVRELWAASAAFIVHDGLDDPVGINLIHYRRFRTGCQFMIRLLPHGIDFSINGLRFVMPLRPNG
ncbi:hypothetical protein KIH86_07785 [Paenibacillus sp. HN-1]|uniref:hypothetical protein n=1 Tax=Paenibacillus TaxID=44249 RepID=UPI001CA96910|nr:MULTISPECIES: hypothetical protein [Paenibacillus]MBY9078603.1 hypothetical protein [Paenibacillus sp. CGMCC 1.18879]MBY9084139.1 hypothetical protein [Paenibacillus sinensis]